MKKLLALLVACSTMAVAFVGCNDDNKSKSETDDKSSSSSVSESSDESSESSEESEESSKADTPAINSIDPGQVDAALVGDWYNPEMGGSICFTDDNKVSMAIDYSELMYFDADKNLMLSGISCPSEYDGSVLSVVMTNETLGIEPETDADGNTLEEEPEELLTLERIGSADTASIDGEYLLISGGLYDELSASIYNDAADSKIIMIINGEELMLRMSICEYSADGEVVQMLGDGLEIFGSLSGDDAVCSYTVSGDTLSLTDNSGEAIEFTKNS